MLHSRRISSSSTETNLIHFYKAKSSRQLRTHFICQLYRILRTLQKTSIALYQNLIRQNLPRLWTITQSLTISSITILSCQHQLPQSLLIQNLNYLLKPHRLLGDAALHQTSSRLLKHQESGSDRAHLTQTLHKIESLLTATYATRIFSLKDQHKAKNPLAKAAASLLTSTGQHL
jgi:hypothetical protein